MEGFAAIVGGRSERFGRKALVVGFLILGLALMASLVPGGPVSQAGAAQAKGSVKIDKLFNSRYCEVFGVSPNPTGGFSVQVFNTIGLGSCPQQQWDELDYAAIAKAEGWLVAAPNGPRYWLMDTISGAEPTNPKNFGGIPMRQVAMVETQTLQPQPFTEFQIQRRTTYVFNKGRTIFVLNAPDGSRYVMQAYTRTIEPTLNPRTLKDLATNPLAAFPGGWTLAARKLRRPLVLKAGGEATIIRDGVSSVYQKVG